MIKKWNQKNKEESAKPNSHISSTLHMICTCSDSGRHTVTNTFTTLHCKYKSSNIYIGKGKVIPLQARCGPEGG